MTSDADGGAEALVAAVETAFAPSGAIAGADFHFRPRSGQIEMACEVARAVVDGGVLVVEAGTGVGKTFAYLVPALLSGERVLISTATKTLQDQLFGRDLPHLVRALGVPVRTALLKGRASYLCLHRLPLARQNVVASADHGVAHALVKVEAWAPGTSTGDLAELAGLDDRSPVIPLITSTRENCLGTACPSFKPCHVNLARRQALAAHVVVINHHLFFADLAVRESGMAELLPTVRVVVFDEAHQINETGVQFLGEQFTTGQLLDLARDMLAAGLQGARGLHDWPSACALIDRAARDLRLVAGVGAGAAASGTVRWTGLAPDGVAAAQWANALQEVEQALQQASSALDMFSELGPDFVRLHERTFRLIAKAQRFLQPPAAGTVRWLDLTSQACLVEAPLTIAHTMRTRLLRRTDDESVEASHAGIGIDADASRDPEGDGTAASPMLRERAWIFTSATLGADPGLRWFTEPCGLADTARVVRVASPFDYAEQSAIYVPIGMPRPSDAEHIPHLARIVGDAAARLGGRTLVLTTTLRSMRLLGSMLQARFGPATAIEVLVQGQWPKRRLMERFREGGQAPRHGEAGRPGCVLVASASFWEGVDVPGDALQLLVIDKLPFPPPGDPLVEARSQQLEAEGRSAFTDYALPEAIVALKQGAGRLIRRESDRGILLVGDTRLVSMGYGKRLMAALPPMRRLRSAEEFSRELDALVNVTTLSTTDPYWL